MHQKTVCISFLLFVSCAVHSQFRRGDKMVGTSVFSGYLNAGNSDQGVGTIGTLESDTRNYGFAISPAIGWFVSGKTVVGGSLTVNPSGQKTTYQGVGGTVFQSDRNAAFNLGLGIFTRHYFRGDGTLRPYLQAGINAGPASSSTEGFFYGGTDPDDYKDSYSGESSGGIFVNGIVHAGLSKMLGSQTSLDFYAGYSYSYTKNDYRTERLRDVGNDGTLDQRFENTTETRSRSHGITLGVAFQVFLSRK